MAEERRNIRMNPEKIYPRTGDRETVYLKHVVTNPNI